MKVSDEEMNNDLISRSALKKAIEEVQYTQDFCVEHQIDYSISMQMLRMVIDNATTVCGNNPKWCESCISNVKCASTRLQNEQNIEDEEAEKHFITACRDMAVEEGLPLYFIYYNETSVLEVYVTETEELFEKRHCLKHLPKYEFKSIANKYLDGYLEWKGKENNDKSGT